MSPRTPREQPIRITTVGTSRGQEIAARQKRYLISMSVRVVCFILAIVTGEALHLPLWVTLIFILIALVIPYIAVVAANAAHTKGGDMGLLESPFGKPELRGGREWREQYDDEQR